MDKRQLLLRISSNPDNVDFKDFVRIIEAFGFILKRSRGSHFMYKKPAVPQLINVQNVSGKAKGYQVKQFLDIIELYNLPFAD
jgi:predicted RNA binding protein YcfA (HicA-like mRNA interferase family)